MPNNNPNFPNFQALLDYIKATPAWLLGFVDGSTLERVLCRLYVQLYYPIWNLLCYIRLKHKEGCFTASFMLYTKGTWGITPQCEFNVTQSSAFGGAPRRGAHRIVFYLMQLMHFSDQSGLLQVECLLQPLEVSQHYILLLFLSS